ncbi:MAG: hypothetical protein KDA61_00230 [Planctomycetales bacterium]|nr:hypothetical protein [Planctomycetales bacterium]
MKTELVAKGRRLSNATREKLERRVHFELSRFSDRIQRIEVMLTDENGPRGGIDAGCRVTLFAKPFGEIVTRALAADLMEAASLALGRASKTLARRLDRLQKFPSHGDAERAKRNREAASFESHS